MHALTKKIVASPVMKGACGPMAWHGSEKMIYDVRMGPQGLHHDGSCYVAYQAKAAGGCAHPHVIRRDPDGAWSKPVRVGTVAKSNHHLAPIIWLDDRGHFHVLYNCHFSHNESRHRVSSRPLDITRWKDGPLLAPSISYPRVLAAPDGRRVLYYRVLGHMGYWTYRLSDDGRTWDAPVSPLVDFDHDPEAPGDEWAGSYHSVASGRNGRMLHVGFVRWDERNRVNSLYGRFVNLWSRYDLYYLKVNLDTGQAFNIRGQEMDRPINRRQARERCLVWETGEQLTNMPSLLIDRYDRPQFLLPVAGKKLDQCRFWFIRRRGRAWERFPVTGTDNIWNASHLEYGDDSSITAFLVGRAPGHGELPYGGGLLQEWRSDDQGQHWRKVGDLPLPRGFLANNPKPLEDAQGYLLPRTLLFFGWEGPRAIRPDGPYHGQAYLWRDGKEYMRCMPKP